jgi:hypothetical protein
VQLLEFRDDKVACERIYVMAGWDALECEPPGARTLLPTRRSDALTTASTALRHRQRPATRHSDPKHGAPVSSIRWHTTVNHHPARHNDHAGALARDLPELRYAQPHLAPQLNPRQCFSPAPMCGDVGWCTAL